LKNVCFLIGNLNSSGGTERVTTLIANQLSKREEYKISVLSLIDGSKPYFNLNSDISIYSLYERKISFKKNLLGSIWKIRQFVKSKNIDTLIVVDSISCIFTVPALYGLEVRHICWEHFHFKNNNGIYFRDFARKLAAKYCDYIVTLTNKDVGFWKEGIKKIKANLVCIPNPTPFIPNENIPKLKYKIALSVGRLVHVKGYDLLIKAWEKSIKNNPDWKLCIVGDGPEEKSLKKLVEDLKLENTVIFTGRTNDVIQYYNSSSFFCLSSRNEGLPMVLLEAQSYNLPLIAFDCDTGPSEIISNNINGYLVKNGDIDKLSHALINMIDVKESCYMQLSNNAKLGALKFDPKNIAKQWHAII
jgi:glycosyltransferase involved in cell wall biosynthesis